LPGIATVDPPSHLKCLPRRQRPLAPGVPARPQRLLAPPLGGAQPSIDRRRAQSVATNDAAWSLTLSNPPHSHDSKLFRHLV
jgi:hypothetical protein